MKTKATNNPFNVSFEKANGEVSHNGKKVKYGCSIERNSIIYYAIYFIDGCDCSPRPATKTRVEEKVISSINEFLNS